jgi:ribonucleoside-diphosphate reductase alpha chain
MFAPAYERRWRNGDTLETEVVVHPLLRQFSAEGRSVAHFQGAYDLSIRDHFEMQRACQRHVDNATSKTVQLKRGTSADELSELYMEYLPELKGVTVYPDGSREDQPLTPLSLEEALRHIGSSDSGVPETQSCPGGVCEL